jgi:site-specific DNA recombinase
MTIRTGKSGRYRYYACSIKARQGETGCVGQSIPMDKLDTCGTPPRTYRRIEQAGG